MRGTISDLILDRKFGFIEADGQRFFFHASALKGVDFSELSAGTPVEFQVNNDAKGDEPNEHPRAINIELTEDAIPTADNEPLRPEKVGKSLG